MNVLRRFYALGGAVVLSLVFVSGDASAQAVSVAFSPVDGVAPVPLSPWAMGLLAAILALFARKALGRSALLVFFGASLLIPCKTGLNEARAYTYATTFDLVFPSPTDSPGLALSQDISVVNATGQTIRIDDVLNRDLFFRLATPTLAPRCVGGVILSPAEVCFIRLRPAVF